jgi:hypothetical protein
MREINAGHGRCTLAVHAILAAAAAAYPPCETGGVINLCAPAPVISAWGWFVLQVPNLIWFAAVGLLLVLGMFLPFPARELNVTGYQLPSGDE